MKFVVEPLDIETIIDLTTTPGDNCNNGTCTSGGNGCYNGLCQ